jgi:hypothetical protein
MGEPSQINIASDNHLQYNNDYIYSLIRIIQKKPEKIPNTKKQVSTPRREKMSRKLSKASLGAEYLHDEDYGRKEGGAENESHTATL